MDTHAIEITPGSELWFEGELVEVRELRADSILIVTGTELRAIATRDFVARATPLGTHDGHVPLSGGVSQHRAGQLV